MRVGSQRLVLGIAVVLIAAIALSPALGRDSSPGRFTPAEEQQQDPWEKEKPVEGEKDVFENEISLDGFDLICPTIIPSTACLFHEGVTTAHFLEASLYILNHLRI